MRTHQRSCVTAPHMTARRCSPVPQVWLCTPAAEELSLAQDTSSGSYIGGLPEWPDPPPSRVELECGQCGDPLVLLAQLSAPFPEVESRVLYILGCNKYACSQSSERCVCVFARTMLPMLGSTGLALVVCTAGVCSGLTLPAVLSPLGTAAGDRPPPPLRAYWPDAVVSAVPFACRRRVAS